MEELPDYYEVLGINSTATSRYNGPFKIQMSVQTCGFYYFFLLIHAFFPPPLLSCSLLYCSFCLQTKSEIRDAYKLRALETHPDRYPIIDSTVTREEATKAFQKVADAYFVLNDPTQREKYGMVTERRRSNYRHRRG